ncbi:MAG: class I SAM-dependent methyltransferase [Rubricoccaceae bacterium]
MANALHDPTIRSRLDRLHREASRDLPAIARGFLRSLGRRLQPRDMADAYIAISREQGELLYALLCATRATRIVEFGASFGISTLYLGAAARQTGGTVISTEIEPEKCRVARENIAEAGLDDIVTILEGDAMQTLLDLEGPIDHLFLDGWNDLYLPLLELLEPRFAPGATLVTDNARFASAKPFIRHLKGRPETYATTTLKTSKGATEFTTYLG